HQPTPPLFPYTTLFRSLNELRMQVVGELGRRIQLPPELARIRNPKGPDPGPADLDVLRGQEREGLGAELVVGQRGQQIAGARSRSEEHTSELQSRFDLV